MRNTLTILAAAIAFTLAATLALAPGASASNVMVTKAYARASATPTAEAGAAYVSLMAHGEADRLLGVSSPAAKMAALHKTVEADGVMKMEHVEALDIPADGMLEMKPGGYHIMLIDLAAPLETGQEFDIVLTFANAGEVTVTVVVGDTAP